MRITPEYVAAEHRAAMAAMTVDQRRAVSRIQRATRARLFNGREPDDNLTSIFAAEATARSVIA